jgi:hypothetical protein
MVLDISSCPFGTVGVYGTGGIEFMSPLNKRLVSAAVAVLTATSALSAPKPLAKHVEQEQKSDAEKNDCVLVAFELMTRLVKDGVNWTKMVGFMYAVNGKPVKLGHCFVLWKMQGDSKILVSDVSGTFQLDTALNDLDSIRDSLAAKLSEKSGVMIEITKIQFVE